MIKLKLRYVLDFENWVQMFVYISAIVTISGRHTIVGTEKWNAAVVRGIAATGICFAWLELIFIVGRYPIKGSKIGVMFFLTIK